MEYSKEEHNRLLRSTLILRAVEEIALQEFHKVQGTNVNKQNVKVVLKRAVQTLEKETEKSNDFHDAGTAEQLRELRKEELEIMNSDSNIMYEEMIKISQGQETTIKVDAHQKLKNIQKRREDILKDGNDIAQSYYAILDMIEKISIVLTKANLTQVFDVHQIIDMYITGELKMKGN